jgi:DNA-binding CsgD family transcriptional regulator
LEIFRSALADALAVGDAYMPAMLVAGIGIALGLSGPVEVGIRLMAASAAEIDRAELMVFPTLSNQLESGKQILERRVDPAVFRAELLSGAQLSFQDAVELALSTRVAPEPVAASPKLPAGLTAREAEVLTLLAAGNTNRQIATQLVLSLRTVETHIFNVYSKTNTGGRAAATGWAIANGIYSPST